MSDYQSTSRSSKHLLEVTGSFSMQSTKGVSNSISQFSSTLSHLTFMLLLSCIIKAVSHRSYHKTATFLYSISHHSGRIICEKKTNKTQGNKQENNMHLKNKLQVPFAPQHLVAAELTGPIVSVYWASSLMFSQGNACLEREKGCSRLDMRKQDLFHSTSSLNAIIVM